MLGSPLPKYLAVTLALFTLAALAAGPVRAQDDAPVSNGHFTVLISSAYARSDPDENSARVFSVFFGEDYPVLERSADDRWVRVSNGSALSGWLPADFGLWRPGGPASAAEVAEARAQRAAAVPRL